MSHQHFSNSGFHQSNKTHSGGKHDSKGAIRKKQKGKISGERASIKTLTKELSKKDKLNIKKQLSKNKKMAILDRKRFGTIEGAPKIVAMIALGEVEDMDNLKSMLLTHCETMNANNNLSNNISSNSSYPTTSLNAKQRMTLLTVPRDVSAVLDISKVADILLLVVPAEEGIDEIGDKLISLIKAQGLPYVFGIIDGLEKLPEKKRHEAKKEHQRIIHQYFPGEPRILPLDNSNDAAQVIRFIENCTVHSVHWRERRPYLLVQNVSAEEGESKEFGTVKVSGYLRGANMTANQLVHIPGVGDFQLKKIEMLSDPNPIGRNKDAPIENKALFVDEPNDKQESLVTENVPDLLLNEQTWPTPEELAGNKKKVPKGTSAYQASWIVDEDEEPADKDSEGDENMDDEEQEPREDEHAEDDDEDEGEEEEIDLDEKSNGTDKDSVAISETSRADRANRAESELMFPDEVDCPLETPARHRFQKYRGLKSFRTTPWDPKENLPLDYGRIFQFSSFNRSMNNSMDATNFPIPVGNYVVLHIANVPLSYVQNHVENPNMPLMVGGLFKYENKMSVLQFNVVKHQTYEDPVQSKDTLVFHVGIRRYTTQPVFSTINPGCAKQKFERFLQPSRPSCATIYGPVTFPPNPLLVFTSAGELVATGTLHAVDPDRIVVKKIVLTGSPAKVHKRGAVIRDMFYFPEDSYWFKPVELWTKNGKVGHIKESVGTHGLMKCTFDTPINQNDTVCLSLYKRVFPKWPKVSPSIQYQKENANNEAVMEQ